MIHECGHKQDNVNELYISSNNSDITHWMNNQNKQEPNIEHTQDPNPIFRNSTYNVSEIRHPQNHTVTILV